MSAQDQVNQLHVQGDTSLKVVYLYHKMGTPIRDIHSVYGLKQMKEDDLCIQYENDGPGLHGINNINDIVEIRSGSGTSGSKSRSRSRRRRSGTSTQEKISQLKLQIQQLDEETCDAKYEALTQVVNNFMGNFEEERGAVGSSGHSLHCALLP